METGKVLIIAVILALICGAIGGAVTGNLLKIKGDRGLQGIAGEDGKDGEDGIQGPQGIQGEKGDKGDKGARGDTGRQGPQGETGPQGPAGEDGEDCQCNEEPMIIVNTSDSYTCNGYLHGFNFIINISVNDPEDDNKVINLYYKWNEDDDWVRGSTGYLNHWISDSNDDYFVDEMTKYSIDTCREIWWLVEVDDGLNIVTHIENTQLCLL